MREDRGLLCQPSTHGEKRRDPALGWKIDMNRGASTTSDIISTKCIGDWGSHIARGQGDILSPVQLTTSRIGNLTRLIHTLLYVMTIHTYIHTYYNNMVIVRLCSELSSFPESRKPRTADYPGVRNGFVCGPFAIAGRKEATLPCWAHRDL